MNVFGSLLAGLLFGCGLLLSGMNNPQRVLGFLDITGRWDPSLAFTMVGAIGCAASGFWLLHRRGRALNGAVIEAPVPQRLDSALWFGSALFGIGWGLSGICPGPALLLLVTSGLPAWLFAAAVVVGMYASRPWKRRQTPAGMVSAVARE